MKNKLSLVLAIVSLLTVALFVIACGGPAAPAAPSGQAPTKEFSGELNFWSGYPELKPVYDKVAADFQAKYPKVKVNVLTAALRDHEQKLASSVSTGTGPDVYEGNLYSNYKFIESGAVSPVPAWVKDQTKGYWDEWVTNYFTINGQLYALPFFESRAALYFNKDCFKEAGLPEPASDKPMSWDEFINAAKKTTKYDASGKVSRAGFSLRLSGQGSGVGEKFWYLGYPLGLDTWQEAGDGKYKITLNSEAGRKALQTYIDMLYNWKTDSIDLQHDAQGFELGQSCMFQRESWVVGDIAQKAPNLNYGAAPMPKSDRWGTIRNAYGLWVPKSAQDQDLAWTFAQFMLQPEYQKMVLNDVGWLSSRQDVDYSDIVAKKPALKAYLFKDPNYGYFRYPPLAVYDEIQTKFSDRLVKAYLDSSLANNPDGIKKVLDEATAEGNAILKRVGKLAE